jgi:nuclease S1
MKKLVIACLIQFALLAQAHAWGPEGHSIVAEIAQRRLTPEAAAKVREILGENASLASIASWADDYRGLHLDSADWHFVDIPLVADDYEESRIAPRLRKATVSFTNLREACAI